MCTGVEIAFLAATALSVGSSVYAAQQRTKDAEQGSLYEKDAAKEQAQRIMRARSRQVSAARAATAASGTKLDTFSEINTNEIERLGASDEQMTLLTGERRGRSMMSGAANDENAAKLNGIGDLLVAGYQVGWKKPKGDGGVK